MLKVLLISNICLEPCIGTCLREKFLDNGQEIYIDNISFSEYREHVNSIATSKIIVVYLSFEELYPNILNNVSSGETTFVAVENDCIQKCKKLYADIRHHSSATIIWFSFEDYYCHQSSNYGSVFAFEGLVDRLNFTLIDLLKEDMFVDFKRLIANVGINNAYDIKSKYRWNAPYSKELIHLMINEVYKKYLIVTGNTKKCLVLDCDNVLWGGILSEDGIEGIRVGNSGLGRSFQDFQRYLITLYYHGVILTVCSKNDESDVRYVFNQHSGMLLKEDHIACFMCNWENKPNNIKAIAERLNIDLTSIVFVDDSVFEIEGVKKTLPDVTTIQYKRENIYDELSCFNLKRDMDIQVVRERTNTYKTNNLRFELRKKSLSYEDYISSLKMVVDIHKTKIHELSRVSELTQRTNKCTNGKRYTLEQLKYKLSLNGYSLYTVCLSDKFSDLGIVGVIGLDYNCLDLFALSCRALGRGIEDRMLSQVVEKGISNAAFIKTGKNASFFDSMKQLDINISE